MSPLRRRARGAVRRRFDEPVVVTVMVEEPGLDDGSAAGLGLLGFAGGLAVGLSLWSWQMRRYRRDLFSESPVRRYAALGWVAARPSAATARVLHDYVRWEPKAVLRRRAEVALRRMERDLDR